MESNLLNMSGKDFKLHKDTVDDSKMIISAYNDICNDVQLSKTLKQSGVVITDEVKQDFEDLEMRWIEHPIWIAFGTKLDESDIIFFLPDMFNALVHLTGLEVDFIKAETINGSIALYLVGVYRDEQPMGPFWDKSFPDLIDMPHTLDSSVLRILRFAKAMQDDLDKGERMGLWKSSYQISYEYLTVHRQCVREVGRILSVDMEDHDLTKSRIVQMALGYLWHWNGSKTESDLQLNELAMDAIRAGHLEVENHHPEYKRGHVEVEKLFTDRIAVHLQKDPRDEAGGWDLNPKFIPVTYKTQWGIFKQEHKEKDLNKNVRDILIPTLM